MAIISLQLVGFADSALCHNKNFQWFGILFKNKKYYFGYVLITKKFIFLEAENFCFLKKNLGRYLTVHACPYVDLDEQNRLYDKFFNKIEEEYIFCNEMNFSDLRVDQVEYLGMISFGAEFDSMRL